MFENVEQVAPLDVEDNVLEPDAALRPELRVLRAVPVEVLHCHSAQHNVCLKAHIGVDSSVPASVPKPGPMSINRQPTPTKLPMENGPEIFDFRPVL